MSDEQPLRHGIYFSTQRGDERPVVRLFWMDLKQAGYFAKGVTALMKACMVSEADANTMMEKLVICYLKGDMPPKWSPELLLRGRFLFPVLTDVDLNNLKWAGAPRGRLSAIILQINRHAEEGEEIEGPLTRTVIFVLNKTQQKIYNATIQNVIHTLKVMKTEAWLMVNAMVGRVIGGADVLDDEHGFVEQLAEEFTPFDVHELPDATEEQIRRWAFTDEKILYVPR